MLSFIVPFPSGMGARQLQNENQILIDTRSRAFHVRAPVLLTKDAGGERSVVKRFCILLLLATAGLAAEKEKVPQGVGVDEKLGEAIPGKNLFYKEDGKEVSLASLLPGSIPVIIVPAYYECPRLCTYVLNGLRAGMQTAEKSGLLPGRDYRVITFSFDAREDAALAREKGKVYRESYEGKPIDAGVWQFLTGRKESIASLLAGIGYKTRPDGEKDFSHPASIVILTPDGRISRYLYGVEFPDRDFRLALVEASGGRIGTPTDRIMTYCFRYDETKGRYAPYAWGFVRILSVLIFFFTTGTVIFLRLRERKG